MLSSTMTKEQLDIFNACNRPTTLKVVIYWDDGSQIHIPIKDYEDESFVDWLTNGSNEHPKEYWIKFWRTGEISKQDIEEQNTFVMGFLETLYQSDECPSYVISQISKLELRKGGKLRCIKQKRN